MSTRIIFLIISIGFGEIVAQKENNIWYFGNQAGLDFNSGNPVVLTDGALFTYDYSSTVSDSAGNLLFYTNGVTVWNKTHVVMTNGTGLLGHTSGGQSALIVRQPGTQIYYIFTTDAMAGPNGLRYSRVDMSLNGGLGGVIQKNVLLFSPSTEKLDAVYSCGDNGIWVLSHAWNSNQFMAYKLTSTGLNTTPVTSSVGSVHTGGSSSGYNAMGQMTLSKDGLRLVCGICSLGNFEVFDFDISTGIVSNPIILTGFSNAWGAAFSPDGKLLYVTRWYDNLLKQLNLTFGTSAAILSSAITVGTVTGPGTYGYYIGYLQLGPDDKIYVSVFDDTYLAVVNNPNALGLSCNFIDNGIYLGGRTGQVGLSKIFAKSNFSSNSINSQNFCFGNQTNFSLFDTNQVFSCTWDFDDPLSGANNSSSLLNPSHTFTSPGTYFVQVMLVGSCITDTISQTITIDPLPLITIYGNVPVCNGDSVFLTATGGISYLWNNGNTNPSMTVLNGGTYFVTVADINNCPGIDSVVVLINPSWESYSTETICDGDSIFLQGNYQTQAGIFYDTLLTLNGCDSIMVTSLSMSNFIYDSLAFSICEGDSFFVQGAFQNISGNYYDTLPASGICDSIINTLLTFIPATLNNINLSICNGDSTFLQGAYQTMEGIYFDTLPSFSGCDSIIITNLQVNQAATPDFSFNFYQCTYSIQFANLSSDINNYKWDFGDGTTDTLENPIHSFADSGTYPVSLITNPNSCSDTLTLIVTINPLPNADFTDSGGCDLSKEFYSLKENYFSVNWSFGDGKKDTVLNPSHIYSGPGIYEVALIVRDSSGCSDTLAKNVFVENSKAEFSFRNQECSSEILFSNASINAGSYWWDFGDGESDTIASPGHTYKNGSEYSVMLVINNGTLCADTVTNSIIIQDEDISVFYLPNAFTPNGDDLNDFFEIKGISPCSIFKLMIFNRWGELIFISEDRKNLWDGNFKGIKAKDGIYAYILEIDKITKTGHIALVK